MAPQARLRVLALLMAAPLVIGFTADGAAAQPGRAPAAQPVSAGQAGGNLDSLTTDATLTSDAPAALGDGHCDSPGGSADAAAPVDSVALDTQAADTQAAEAQAAGAQTSGTAAAGTAAVAPLAAPVKVWMAGDSTMQPSSGACPVGWGNQFGSYFTSDATIVNSAIGGRSIQTWLYDPNVTTTMNSAGECVISPETFSTRWQAMLNSSTGMKAGDYLFIQFGINDGSATCNRHVGSARYKELLGVMARAAQQRGAHPIFVTPVAAITCSGSVATANRGFVTETFDAAAANNVPVIDLHKLSYTLYNSLHLCPNNGDYTSGAVGAFFCNDHTHFEAAGAQQIAGLIATALRNQGIALAAYLK